MTPRARRIAAIAAGAAWLPLYLFVIGDLSIDARAGWRVVTAASWSDLWLRARGPFQFEPVVMLEAGLAVILLSPLNLLIGGLLGALLALNVHGILALRELPAQCRVPGTHSGWLAPVPALLAGGACCAPAILLLIGIPGLGAFAGLFGWLVPLSFALLIASRWWQRRLGAPRFLATGE